MDRNGEFYGFMSLAISGESLQELQAARESVEDILSKLDAIYQGETVELKKPSTGSELENIDKGLEAINQGYPKEIVKQYFLEGLASIKKQYDEILSTSGTLAREVAYSFTHARDGIIPTPPCISKHF